MKVGDPGHDGQPQAAARLAAMVQAEWLRVLIRNLVDNAIRYTPEGGRISIAVTCDGAACRISVSDSGSGIPADAREAVLRRFHRLNHGGQPGSGLGLAIVARIADLHGATLQLDDVIGAPGLSVTVRWPKSRRP